MPNFNTFKQELLVHILVRFIYYQIWSDSSSNRQEKQQSSPLVIKPVIEPGMHSSITQQSPSESTPVSSSSNNNDGNILLTDLHLSITPRKASRSHIISSRYHQDIANFVSYEFLSPSYRSFIASLTSISVPSHWKNTVADPKWKEVMLEEMKALAKNNT